MNAFICALAARVCAAIAARFQVPDCCPHPDLTPEETSHER